MLGLPTETDEDVLGIAELANQVLHTWRMYATNKARGVRITVSTSCFVPKPHSPFQWEQQVTMDEYKRKVNLLRENIKAKNVTYNWHDPDTSFVEAVLSRGDRRIADVIEEVWRRGRKARGMGRLLLVRALDVRHGCLRRRSDALRLPPSAGRMSFCRGTLWTWVCAAHTCGTSVNRRIRPSCHRRRKQCTGCGALSLMTEGGKCDA